MRGNVKNDRVPLTKEEIKEIAEKYLEGLEFYINGSDREFYERIEGQYECSEETFRDDYNVTHTIPRKVYQYIDEKLAIQLAKSAIGVEVVVANPMTREEALAELIESIEKEEDSDQYQLKLF